MCRAASQERSTPLPILRLAQKGASTGELPGEATGLALEEAGKRLRAGRKWCDLVPAKRKSDIENAAPSNWLHDAASACLDELAKVAQAHGCQVERRNSMPRGHLTFQETELLSIKTPHGHEGYIAMGWRGGDDYALAVKRPGKTNQFAWHQFARQNSREACEFAKSALHQVLATHSRRGPRPSQGT
jgi:hypothetical protein